MNDEIQKASDLMRGPLSYPVVTYLGVLILATWGALVRVIREVQLSKKTPGQIACIFLAESCISGFVGLNTFLLCESMGTPPLYAVVLSSVASYMGGRSLVVFEAIWKYKFSKQTGDGDGKH